MTAVTPLAIPAPRSIEETDIQTLVTFQVHLASRRSDRSKNVTRLLCEAVALANERRYYSALRRLAELLALTVGKADPEYAECMADVERADDFHSLIRQRLHVSR